MNVNRLFLKKKKKKFLKWEIKKGLVLCCEVYMFVGTYLV